MAENVKEMVDKLMQRLPEGAAVEMKSDREAEIRFELEVGNKGLSVVSTVRPSMIVFRGSREYPFKVNEAECRAFTDRMSVNGTYANGNAISVSYRKILHGDEGIEEAADAFMALADQAVKEYE